MVSGLHWEMMQDYFQGMFMAPDKTAFGQALRLDHQPGEWWEYNNMAEQNLATILRAATGQDVDVFAQQHLFSSIRLSYPGNGPVGWYKDQAGNAQVFDGVQLSCRGLARMGHLWLNNGSWAGHQVVSKEFVQQSLQSSDKNSAYGYLWWLGRSGHWSITHADQGHGTPPMFPEGSDDVFAMLGGQGQVAIVEPTDNVVIVRLGNQPPAGDAAFVHELLTIIRRARNQPEDEHANHHMVAELTTPSSWFVSLFLLAICMCGIVKGVHSLSVPATDHVALEEEDDKL